MSTDRYIVIPNWDGFQHYKDRTPKWIKNYTELLADDAYLGLTGHQRAVLHGLWLEYASARCQLAVNTLSLTRRLNLKVTTQTLDALSHAGFITFTASKPLAKTEPRLEVEVDKKVVKNPKSANNGKGAHIAIATMIKNGAIPTSLDLEAELRAHPELNDEQLANLRSLVPSVPMSPDDDIPL